MTGSNTTEVLSPEKQVEELFAANQKIQADYDELLAINAELQAMLDSRPTAKGSTKSTVSTGVIAEYAGKKYSFRSESFILKGFGKLHAAEAAANPKVMAELVKRQAAVLIEI